MAKVPTEAAEPGPGAAGYEGWPPATVVLALEALPEAVAVVDGRGRLRWFNQRLRALYPELAEGEAAPRPGEVLDSRLAAAAASCQPGECCALPGGRWLRLQEQPLEGGGRVLLWTDVTAFKEREQALEQQCREAERHAYHDPLTGLPNRRLAEDRLAQALAHARRHGTAMAVLFLDLDRFKAVNDYWGHCIGDRALAVVAERLSAACREEDTIGRWGGDELIGVYEIDAEAPQASAARIASALLGAVERELIVDGSRIALTASIGIALYTGGEADPEALIRAADQALFRVKGKGGNAYQFGDGV